MWYGIYHRQTKILTYASAGHPAAILRAADQSIPVKFLKTRGSPVGIFADSVFIEDTCYIETGSNLYIFSDGIYEFMTTNGDMGDFQRLITNITNLHSSSTVQEILKFIQSTSASGYFDDDCSLVQVKFNS
jgi:phosphoserine phosphatase RsbU/P